MVFLRLSLKKEMCKRSLSNEGMTGKRLHLKPVVAEHFWSREGEKTGFSPPFARVAPAGFRTSVPYQD